MTSDVPLKAARVSRWRWIPSALLWTACIGVLAATIYVANHPGRRRADLVFSAIGLVLAYKLVLDVARGRTSLPARGNADGRYDYVRSADPIGFWVLIGLQAAFAAAIVVTMLGDILGTWSVWS